MNLTPWCATPQPPPRPGGPSVLDDIEAHDTLPHAVREGLRAREVFGLKKYGTRLCADNGRAPLVDLVQELLDGTVYAWQAAMESKGIGRIGWRLLSLALGWLALGVGWLA